MDFTPFVAEYCGAFGSDTKKVFDQLMPREYDRRGPNRGPNWSANTPEREWLQKFAVCLHNGHASGLLHIYRRIVKASPSV